MHDDTPVCNVPRRHCEAATVTSVLNLSPLWNQVRWWDQECRPPRFFGWARLRLSACAVGRHVEVTSSDVYEVQLGNFPELTQKAISQFLASSRWCCLDEQRTIKYIRPKVSWFGVPRITCCGHHASRLERIFAKQNELICTVAMFVASSRRDSASCSKITRKAPTTLFVTLPLSPAFQVKMETRLILQPVACLFVYPSERPHISFVCSLGASGSPRSRAHRTGTVQVVSRVGSDASGARTSLSSSCSVAQDSVGVSHGFLSVRISLEVACPSSSSDWSSCPFHCHGAEPLSFPLGSFPRPSGHEQRTPKKTSPSGARTCKKKNTSPERIPQVWRQSFTRARTRNQFCNERNSASTGAEPLN